MVVFRWAIRGIAVSTTRTEQFSIGRVVGRTFSTVGENFVTFAIIAVIFVALPTALTAWIQREAIAQRAAMVSAGTVSQVAGLFPSPMQGAISIGIFLFQLAMSAAAKAAIIYGVIAGLGGRKASLSESLAKGLANWWPIVLISICVSVMTMIGYVLLFVPGILLAIRWIVAVPAQVMEGRGVFASMGRSAELTKGNRWSIFGLLIVSSLILIAIELAVGLAMAPGIAFAQALNTPGFQIIAAPILSLVITPLFSAGVASLYFELRSTKEGVGVEALASVFD